jgi:hypothetical protein
MQGGPHGDRMPLSYFYFPDHSGSAPDTRASARANSREQPSSRGPRSDGWPVMSRHRPDERADDGASSSRLTDHGVLEAEKVVRGAWEQVLLERRDHMEAALEAAFVRCDTAYQHLAAAQRAGNPKAIGNAHAALEKALDEARTSSIAGNRVRQADLAELSWLAREIDGYTTVAGATKPGQGALGPEAPTQAVRPRPAPPASAIERFTHRVRRWFAQSILRGQSLAPWPAAPRRTYV